MRAWPLFECFIVILLGTAVLFPLVRLTGADATVAEGMTEDHHAEELVSETCWITIRSPNKMQTLRVSHEGKALYDATPQARQVELEAELSIATLGLELTIEVEWTSDVESMVEVRVEPDGQASRVATIWGEHSLDDVVEFRW